MLKTISVPRAAVSIRRQNLIGRSAVKAQAASDTEGATTEKRIRRYALTLKKPMGMILEERNGRVVVEELVKGGNAEKVGVQVGDVVTETSALVLKAGKESEFENVGHGATPYNNWDQVMLNCEGKDFDTVMGAIASNNERWGYFTVDLVIARAE